MQEEKPNNENENGVGFKELIEKAAPYIRIIIQNRKRLLIINGVIAVVSIAILLLLVKIIMTAQLLSFLIMAAAVPVK